MPCTHGSTKKSKKHQKSVDTCTQCV